MKSFSAFRALQAETTQAEEHQPPKSKTKSRRSDLNTLHRSLGNRAVGRLFRSGVIQAKLKVGRPDDKFEREAERVAEQVMRMPAQDTDRSNLAGEPSTKQVDLRPPGQSLETDTRRFMEARFGVDFGSVRIHTDHEAAESAQAINARAFTDGLHVHFAAGEYQPHTEEGQKLIAHELTHVVQQSNLDAIAPESKLSSVVPMTQNRVAGIQRQIQAPVNQLIQANDPDLLAFVFGFERLRRFIYIDGVGLPTVGIGHCLKYRNQTQEDGIRETIRIHNRYGFWTRGPQPVRATEQMVRDEFINVMNNRPSTLELTEDSCRLLQLDDVRRRINGLNGGWPGPHGVFGSFPRSVQIALVDLGFNTGVPGLLHYPRHAALRNAVNNSNWAAAAQAAINPAQSGVSRPIRNRERARLLREQPYG